MSGKDASPGPARKARRRRHPGGMMAQQQFGQLMQGLAWATLAGDAEKYLAWVTRWRELHGALSTAWEARRRGTDDNGEIERPTGLIEAMHAEVWRAFTAVVTDPTQREAVLDRLQQRCTEPQIALVLDIAIGAEIPDPINRVLPAALRLRRRRLRSWGRWDRRPWGAPMKGLPAFSAAPSRRSRRCRSEAWPRSSPAGRCREPSPTFWLGPPSPQRLTFSQRAGQKREQRPGDNRVAVVIFRLTTGGYFGGQAPQRGNHVGATRNSTKNTRRTLRLVTEGGARLPGPDGDDRGGGSGGAPGGLPPDGSVEPVWLDIGSDVEIAGRLAGALRDEHGEVWWCEHKLWFFLGTHWVPYVDDPRATDTLDHADQADRANSRSLRLAVHRYDGAVYLKPGRINPERVQLGRNRINSVLSELAAICAAPGFFDRAPIGISCQSGFIRIGEDGSATLEPHCREHRCRHLVAGHWTPPEPGEDRLSPPPESLLGRLLYGSFAGDADADDKIKLVAESLGSGPAGLATRLRQPKAVIYYGPGADNGKSQILGLPHAMLPKNAVVAISPDKFGDDRYVIGLAGAQVNTSGELSNAKAIASEAFKMVVSGDMMSGRALWRNVETFSPRAQHLYAANFLPSFSGGVDRGVERRLLVLPFSRAIPTDEQIERLGDRIITEEADLLLAFVVAGASRLRANGAFTVPQSSAEELRKWLSTADPVRAWVGEQVTVKTDDPDKHWVTSRRAHELFVEWARGEGFRADTLPAVNGFVQRLRSHAPGVIISHGETGNRLTGIRIGDKRWENRHERSGW